MTQRDKMLLVLLAVILVVALVVILPGVGVMSCRTKIQEYQEQTAELDEELATALAELREMGVDSAYAENFRLAKDRLEKKIMEQKQEAARLAHSIMAYAESYDVDEQWIYGLEYKTGVMSDENNLLVEYDKFADVERTPNDQSEYTVGETIYTLRSANRIIKYTISEHANCYLDCSLVLEGYKVNDIAALLLYIQQITSKGSLLINEVTYNSVEGTGTVSLTAMMTATDGISRYAQEIAEAMQQEEEPQY